jgi:subtilisin family serine protease
VSQRDLDLSKPYVSPSHGGKGVDVYVVDTGVVDTHTDFGGRAKQIKSFIDGEAPVDMNGHGTHCAGTIGSMSYGVAKDVSIYGVKCLNGGGSGTWAGVTAAIDFAGNYTRDVDNPRIISMSLGGGRNEAVNSAVTAAAARGVIVVSAAGNSYGADACNFSPAGAPGGLAVGATDNTDKLAYYSNAGKCVGILAPGTDITSLWLGADGATNKISGTSMATPHVAGVAALFLAKNRKATPQEVFDALIAASTKDKVTGLNADTKNRLLFNFRKE